MKHRDLHLLALPLALLLLVAATVGLLFVQFRTFQQATLHEARENLSQHTHVVSELLLPDLRVGNLEAAKARIATFKGHTLRLTLIDAKGAVIADSAADATHLANHADRPEVVEAEHAAADGFVVRYSHTLQSWLLYYAVTREGWTLRAALPMAAVNAATHQLRDTLILALLLGLSLAGGLALYLFLRVRPHFNALQESAVAIARGNLSAEIPTLESGPLRELARAIAIMTRQLQETIADLRHQRNTFDALVNTLRDPLLLLSHTGEVLFANQAAAKLFGKAARRPGYRIERTLCTPLVDYVRTAFDAPTLESKELAFDDGATPRTLLAHAVRMERDGALCLLLLLTDLTDLRRLESLRADFVANVSHEVKTPLTAILSTVETLSEVDLPPPAREKCLDILGRQAKRLNALVQDLLSLADIERRQGTPNETFTRVNLNNLLADVQALCSDEAERAGATLEVEPAAEPLAIRGDGRLLEQALINLVTNALRHAETPRVVLGLKKVDGRAELTVRDEGIGIAEEHLPRLFERFYRVHKDRSRQKGGTGLGLAIVKHIALLHHGSIAVASTVGQGTTFTLSLPF